MVKCNKPDYGWNETIRKLSGLDSDKICPECNSGRVIQTYQDFESGFREYTCSECHHTWNE